MRTVISTSWNARNIFSKGYASSAVFEHMASLLRSRARESRCLFPASLSSFSKPDGNLLKVRLSGAFPTCPVSADAGACELLIHCDQPSGYEQGADKKLGA
jgi:hypothetical protein